MSEELDAVVSALQSTELIDAEHMRRWMHDCNLRLRGAAYHLIQRRRDQIVPPLSTAEQSSFMIDYLFDCLLLHPESDDYLHSGFEAAWELAGWIKQLERLGGNDAFISQVIQRLTEEYIAGDDETRNRIETGVVEHMMENPAMRRYFASWEGDPTLGTAYKLCLQWGTDHEEK